MLSEAVTKKASMCKRTSLHIMGLCFLLLWLGMKDFVQCLENIRTQNQGQVLAKCLNALHFLVFNYFHELIIIYPLKVFDSLILHVFSSRYINTWFVSRASVWSY